MRYGGGSALLFTVQRGGHRFAMRHANACRLGLVFQFALQVPHELATGPIDNHHAAGGLRSVQRPNDADHFGEMVGLQLLRGRWLNEGDVAGGVAAVVVNETFVRTWLDEGDPIGRTIRIDELRAISTPIAGSQAVAQVVGVVADVQNVPTDPVAPYLWLSMAQFPLPDVVVHAAGPGGADALMSAAARPRPACSGPRRRRGP